MIGKGTEDESVITGYRRNIVKTRKWKLYFLLHYEMKQEWTSFNSVLVSSKPGMTGVFSVNNLLNVFVTSTLVLSCCIFQQKRKLTKLINSHFSISHIAALGNILVIQFQASQFIITFSCEVIHFMQSSLRLLCRITSPKPSVDSILWMLFFSGNLFLR